MGDLNLKNTQQLNDSLRSTTPTNVPVIYKEVLLYEVILQKMYDYLYPVYKRVDDWWRRHSIVCSLLTVAVFVVLIECIFYMLTYNDAIAKLVAIQHQQTLTNSTLEKLRNNLGATALPILNAIYWQTIMICVVGVFVIMSLRWTVVTTQVAQDHLKQQKFIETELAALREKLSSSKFSK